MHAREAARMIHGYALMLTKEARIPYFRISNLGTGKPVSLRDFTAKIWQENGGTGKLNFGNRSGVGTAHRELQPC
jgi:hypothetical protein